MKPDGILFRRVDPGAELPEEQASGNCDAPKWLKLKSKYETYRKLAKQHLAHPNVPVGFYTAAIRACSVKAAEKGELVVISSHKKYALEWLKPGTTSRTHVDDMMRDAKARGVRTWAILTEADPGQVREFVATTSELGVDYVWITQEEAGHVGDVPPTCDLQNALWEALELDPRPRPCLVK